MENSPDFSFDPGTCPYRAGVRPYREKTYRLEPEVVGGKCIIHNYGHGGAGITMSWGCAEIVRDIVMNHDVTAGVAVLGAGVMGLTAATLLAADGKIAVTVYADRFTPHTTSDVAGGQWAPSFVNYKRNDPTAKGAYFEILRRARKAHEARGTKFGVSQRWNYTIEKIGHLDELPTDIVPPATRLAHLPFARLNTVGYKYDLLLVEPPILMARLQEDLETQVSFIKRKFQNMGELATLNQKVIVNCTGLGAGALCMDPLMKPLKGQLVFLRPQTGLDYLFSGGNCYVFPRADAVVVGGSKEAVDDEKPDPVTCKKIVALAKDVFDGRAHPAAALPDWVIGNK